MARSFVLASNQYLEKTGVSSFPITAYPFTLFGRAQVTTALTESKDVVLLSLVDTVDNLSYMQIGFFHTDPSHVLNARLTARNTSIGLINSGTLTEGQIYSLVGVFTSATDREFFVDGVSVGTDATSVTLPSSLDVISVGRNGRGAPFGAFDGDIHEAGISDVAWDVNDAIAYAKGLAGSQIKPESLVSYWPLWSGESPEPDLGTAGNQDDLTLTNAPIFLNAGVGGRYAPFKPTNQATFVKKQEIDHVYRERGGAGAIAATTTWETVLKVGKGTFPPLSRWWLYAQAAIASNNTTNQTRVRILNDGVEVLGSLSILVHKSPNFVDGTNYGFSKMFDFGDNPGDIELQISNSSTSQTFIQSPNIFMMRLDKDFIPEKDYWYRENQLLTDLTTSFDNATAQLEEIIHPIDLIGSGEDVMVFGCVDIEAGGGIDDNRKPIVLLNPPGDSAIRVYINRNAIDEHLTVLARVGTAQSIFTDFSRLRVAVNTSGSESNHKWSSLFVMRKNVFDQALFTNGPGLVINTTTGLEQHIDLAFTPNQVGNFIAIGSGKIGYEAGSTAGLRNGLIVFRKDSTITPVSAGVVFDCDAETLTEDNATSAMAYFKDLPTSLNDIELMAQGNEANDVNFDEVSAFVFSLLPANHFKVSGIVQENGVNVSRTVRAFLSSTGEFLGEDVSNPDTGAYEICGLPGGNVSVVAYDDATGDSFNAQIFDKVVPVE